MDDRDARIKAILERFGGIPESEEPLVQEFKKALEDFLENGPGTPEERVQALVDKMLDMEASYKDFLNKRN